MFASNPDFGGAPLVRARPLAGSSAFLILDPWRRIADVRRTQNERLAARLWPLSAHKRASVEGPAATIRHPSEVKS
jgi:hypothetical protein